MRINNNQYFYEKDPLYFFKRESLEKYGTCNFFSSEMNHEIQTTINMGTVANTPVSERIITDGNISLQKTNNESAYIIWQNYALKIDDNHSVSITIDDASFYVVCVQYGERIRYDIFSNDDSEKLYQNIFELLYHKQSNFSKTSSITFLSPTLISLKSICNQQETKELFDLTTGQSKKLTY